ncbi:ATP-binding protein [candidate division KSB1 bacterium]|nr:ATP-binding protein [candidate division KSB1 bacterium]
MQDAPKRMKNPFSLQPALGTGFYGRGDEIEDILSLGAGTNSLIIGARRSGKTSLLKEIARRIRYFTHHSCVYFSAAADPKGSDLQITINDACNEDTQMSRLLTSTVAIAPATFYDMMKAINEKLRLLSDDRGENRFFFILVDEAELLNQFEDAVLKDIYKTISNCQYVKWILCGGPSVCYLNKLQERKTWITEPFLGSFITTKLGRLSKLDAEALIIHKDADGKPTIVAEKATVDAILEHSYQQPYIIQLLGMKLFENGKLDKITDTTVDWVYVQCEGQGYFMESFENLELPEMEILIETVDPKLKKAINWDYLNRKLLHPIADIERAVDRLIKLCFLKELDGSFLPSTPFLKRWLRAKRNHLKEVIRNKNKPGTSPVPPVPSGTNGKNKSEGINAVNPNQSENKPHDGNSPVGPALYFVMGIFTLLVIAIFILPPRQNLWLYIVGAVLLITGLYSFVLVMTGRAEQNLFVKITKSVLGKLPGGKSKS